MRTVNVPTLLYTLLYSLVSYILISFHSNRVIVNLIEIDLRKNRMCFICNRYPYRGRRKVDRLVITTTTRVHAVYRGSVMQYKKKTARR